MTTKGNEHASIEDGTASTGTDLPRYQLVVDGRLLEAAPGRRYYTASAVELAR
jgi:hypothetical protein